MMNRNAQYIAAVASSRQTPLALVVDDDPQARRPIVELLKLHGMIVIESCDADEALRVAKNCAPNLVIADIMMRGQPEGFNLCWKIKTSPATNQSYVIMLTGLGEQADVDYGHAHGADQYLVKPVSMEMLWEIISKLGVLISPVAPAAH